MEKSATLNLRVNQEKKKQVEAILDRLGISMSAAIDIYLNQIIMNGGIPFSVSIPDYPKSVNADLMTSKELNEHLSNRMAYIQNNPDKLMGKKEIDKFFNDLRAGKYTNG